MSISYYDSDGNPVVPTDAIGTAEQQVANRNREIINPSQEDGNLLAIKTNTDKFTFTSNNLNVNIADGVTLEVNLSEASDSILVYGQDSGVVNRVLRTNTSGELQVGVLSLPSNVDIRTLDSAQDSVEVVQATHDSLQANANLQVANTDVSNSNPVPVSDAGGSITVDGTVAATQSGTWNLNNITGTVSLPTGAATEVTLLSVGTNTSNLDVVLSTRASEATLATLNSKFVSGTDIGDVTINNASGAGAVNIQDGGNSITVDGSVSAVQSGTWNITNITGTVSLPTGAATAVNQDAQTTALQILDNIPHANNVSFNNGVPFMGQLDDVSTDSVSENNVSTVRITASRAVHTNLRNNAGTEVGVAGTPLRVDPTGTTTQPISGTVTANIGTSGSLALEASVTGLSLTQGSTTSGQRGLLSMGAVATSAPSYTNGQTNALSLTTSGFLRTETSSWLGSTAPTIGQKTMANSLPVVVSSNQSVIPVQYSLSSHILRCQTASIITTATTADQVVVTYTVPGGTTFYLQGVRFVGWRTSLPGNLNPIFLGDMSLETPSGTKRITEPCFHSTNPNPYYVFPTALPITAGTVIRIVVTPSAATSTTWRGNIVGYEI